MNALRRYEMMTGFFACVLLSAARSEIGVSLGMSFGQDASFSSAEYTPPRLNDPGAATAGTDHYYDDGFNRVDSSGNAGNQTTFWGYENASQYDASGSGSITMNSDLTTIGASESNTKGDGLPAVEVYWSRTLSENARWNYGIKLAGRWQRIKADSRFSSSSMVETTSDTYDLFGVIPPSSPFAGSFSGPNALLGDAPSRSVSGSAGPALQSERELDGHILGFDVGPSVSMRLNDRWDLFGSLGGTMAYARSTFSYRDGAVASGSVSNDEWLFGAYAGADLRYRVGEDWGLFGGLFYSYLREFTQTVDQRSARLSFDGAYGAKIGLFITR